MSRQLVSSGSPYEPIIGFSRAVRVGNWISVSGTAPIGANREIMGAGSASAQARRCFEIIGAALEEAGSSMSDVVRTRTYLIDIADWEEVARVHGRFLGDVRPASTIIQVGRFIDPEWLVEIEADAIVDRDAR